MTALPQDVETELRRENARLKAELRAAGDRQNASAEILRSIGGASGDAELSLRQIAEITERLFGASSVTVLIADRERWGRTIRVGAGSERIAAAIPLAHVAITPQFMPGAVYLDNRQVHVADADDPAATARWPGLAPARAAGTRTVAGTPLRRAGQAVGVLIVHRDRPEPFTDEELVLQQNFADQAAIAIENARLFNETKEALERQTATAGILQVIASSPSDVQPVFDAVAERAMSLLDCWSVIVTRFDGELVHFGAARGALPDTEQFVRERYKSMRPYGTSLLGRCLLERTVVNCADAQAEADQELRDYARRRGLRAVLAVPLLRDDRVEGALVLTRAQPGLFAPREIELVQTFADQAVIAIQNARLFNETSQALARQTATSDILRVISQSPTDVRPVFDAIVLTAARLLRCDMAFFLRCHGATFSQAALAGSEGSRPVLDLTPVPIDPDANFPSRAIVSKKNLHLPDWSAIDLPEHERHIRETYGINSALFLPLLRADECVGLLALAGKQPGMFGEGEIALAESFRDQALIAIENTRLFNETKEALERQTATADILKVIASSPSDVQPVFEAIVNSAAKLFEPCSATITTLKDGKLHWNATAALLPNFDIERAKAVYPIPFEPDRAPSARAILERRIIEIPDIAAPDTPEFTRKAAAAGGFRSATFVPLVTQDHGIGSIILTQPHAGFKLSKKQLALVQTFADQAVIAIENTRLFNETKEALERQTATADILKVIASSPSDVQPVFEAIAERSKRLVDALSTTVFRLVDGVMHLRAFTSTNPEADATLKAMFPAPLSSFSWGDAVSNGEIFRVVDTERETAGIRDVARLRGFRSMLFVPLLRGRTPIGLIAVTRAEPGPFVEHHVQLLQTFADQAVIAIENVRLFDEVQARTRDLSEALQFQTATSDVLKVISRSPDTLQPVLDVIVETSRHLCGTATSSIFLLRDGRFHIVALSGATPEYLQFLQANPIAPDQRGSSTARAAREKRTVHVPDISADPEFGRGHMAVGQRRALLSVPLLHEGVAIGMITMTQSYLTPFTERQIEVVETFADQAVIAISNVRLFEQVQARTKELAASLDDLRTAQDRLIQTEKLASLGQLTAGIAHEIKNPLNFVNNFAALSAELTDELNDLLKSASLAENTREEVDELTGLLKDNLEKVVQHGKRADSIVKNMLLHSREGSGEHRPADINALLEESLNLAYHGARAEKPQFNVTLQRDFDEAAGSIEVFPQEITRVFLNLISNGFYAVTKRRVENSNSGFEPTVSATTRNLGHAVEIRIRDNGTGIAPDVKEKMFNPFFTTKPAGEGTGLGLSMSYDIIVKQHGGRIDVETEPGRYTEFTVVLPRTSILASKNET